MGYIYKLTFASGKAYVGMTTRPLEHRLYLHRFHAERADYGNRLVYNAWRKHGEPTVEVVEEVPDNQLASLEIRYIAEFGTLTPGGYNLTAGGEATLGYKHTEESRAVMKAKRKLQVFSESSNQKRREKMLGNTHAKGRTGRREPLDEATKEKIRATLMVRHPGRGVPLSAEHKAKIGAANKGRKPSREAVERAAALKRGVKHSEERKAKRLASYLATVAKRNESRLV